MDVIPFVDRVNKTLFGYPHIRVGQTKFTDGGIQGKSIHTVTGGIDQHGGRTVDDITCGHLMHALLEAVTQKTGTLLRNPTINRKNSSHRNIHINIRRPIQGVHQNGVFGIGRNSTLNGGDFIVLFGRKNAAFTPGFEGRLELLIGKEVQFFDRLALDIGFAGIAQDIDQTCLVHFSVHDFGGNADIP